MIGILFSILASLSQMTPPPPPQPPPPVEMGGFFAKQNNPHSKHNKDLRIVWKLHA